MSFVRNVGFHFCTNCPCTKCRVSFLYQLSVYEMSGFIFVTIVHVQNVGFLAIVRRNVVCTRCRRAIIIIKLQSITASIYYSSSYPVFKKILLSYYVCIIISLFKCQLYNKEWKPLLNLLELFICSLKLPATFSMIF